MSIALSQLCSVIHYYHEVLIVVDENVFVVYTE